MNDMSSVIVPKSDQINADDLQGRTMDITVTDVQIRGGQEQPVSLFFAESDKAFRPCKSMCRVLVQGWGLDANQYVGKSLTLYCDPTVKFGPLAVGGIRISHMSHLDGPMTMALTATKGVKKAYKVLPLKADRQQSDAPRTKQTPAEWAADHIAFVVGAATLERLAAVQESGKKAMASLLDKAPDLHQQVADAYAKRLDELSAADPFEPEGRTDEQHGDQFDGADDSAA